MSTTTEFEEGQRYILVNGSEILVSRIRQEVTYNYIHNDGTPELPSYGRFADYSRLQGAVKVKPWFKVDRRYRQTAGPLVGPYVVVKSVYSNGGNRYASGYWASADGGARHGLSWSAWDKHIHIGDWEEIS